MRSPSLPWSVRKPPRAVSPVFPDPAVWPDAAGLPGWLRAQPLRKKIRMLSGPRATARALWGMLRDYNREPFIAGADPASGLPGIRFTDGPRGVVMYSSTCFPVAMARGAAWDPQLEHRIADAIGVEARTQGANIWAGICINLLRHPAWGRAQETYGEDPVLLGALGRAAVEGVQRHVMACVKHFAVNSIEDSRFRVSVELDDRTLHELYLPHFYEAVIDGEAACVMSAYNRLRGKYCGHHHELLTEILRDRWGFQGFVMSDFFLGVRNGPKGLAAGLDLEMPFRWRFGKHLEAAVDDGRLTEAEIDRALSRIVAQQIRFADRGEPARYRPNVVAGPAHRALAREAAAAGMVLLKNEPCTDEPLLPLHAPRLRRLAVIGGLASMPVIGDEGSSMVRPPHVVTALDGLRAALEPATGITFDPGKRLRRAARTAARADVAVVVAGYTHADEGENLLLKGGDRKQLTLRPRDERLIRAVAAANPRTVVILIGGSAMVTEAWRHDVPAILMAWYPGMEGGHALAHVLLGNREPGGKLPCVFPKNAADLPPFDPDANRVIYDLFHGYRYQDREGLEPAYPFGWGLRYTTFALDPPQLAATELPRDGELSVRVELHNRGHRHGSEVVQLYVGGPDGSAYERPVKALKSFAKIRLEPGESRTVVLTVPTAKLAVFDRTRPPDDAWVVEPGSYTAWIGTSASLSDLQPLTFEIRK